MRRSIAFVILMLCAWACKPQEHPEPSRLPAQPAPKARGTERAAAPCSEEPSSPVKVRAATPARGVAADFNKLFETGLFQIGYCVAEVRVNADGTVDAVRILRPKPADPRVESAITRTVASWRYTPAMACGRPVPSTATVGFFPLSGQSGVRPEAPPLAHASGLARELPQEQCGVVDAASTHRKYMTG